MSVIQFEPKFLRPWVEGYQHVAGTVRFVAEPAPQIVDLELLPAREFSADFAMLHRPGNEKLLFDVLNRGTARALAVFNEGGGEPCTGEELDPGNRFLMQQGFSVAWCGWQQDLPAHGLERMGLYAPALPDSVQGQVLCEFQPSAPTDLMELSDLGHHPYPATGDSGTLTVREHTEAKRQIIPQERWRFVDDGHIGLDGGFEPGLLYEAVYQARGAQVVGLGLLAVRDVVRWLRREYGFAYAYGFGRSQSGRFLREFLHLGLNEGVFDGVMPLVAGARRGEFNLRFGQPSKTLGQGIGALPPFSDDQLVPEPRPKTMNINSSAEYWGGDRGSAGQASLLHNDGERDLKLPETSRVYLLAGTQHVGSGIPPEDVTTTGIKGQYAFNCVNYNPYLRAALINLDRWVREGIEPPPNRYPRLDDSTAVRPKSGVVQHVPLLQGQTHYVSAVDADGNEVAGIRPPEVAVPLATYTGWNVRHADVGAAGELISMIGATIPFAPDTIAARYESRDQYLRLGRTAAEALAKERYLLEEDIERILGRMGKLWDLYGPHQ